MRHKISPHVYHAESGSQAVPSCKKIWHQVMHRESESDAVQLGTKLVITYVMLYQAVRLYHHAKNKPLSMSYRIRHLGV
jgi:hypothetical protein